jgi:sugar phosphate isomerase/epimerase
MSKTTKLTIVALCALCLTTLALPALAQQAAQGAPNAEKLGWRLACQAYSFNRFTFFEAVDKNASLGLRYLEAYPGQSLSKEKPDVKFDHNMSEETMKEVNAKLASANVKLVNYGVVGLSKDEAESRKVFEFAKKMGIETIVSEPEKDAFPMIDKLTQEYGINMAIHNHPKPSRYWKPEAELEALKGMGPRMGACADTGHWPRSGLNSLECLKKMEGRIISLHFKDLNEMGKDAHDVTWGTGVCDVKAMLTELKRQNVKAVFSIEYEYNWDNSVPDIAECVKAFDKFAAELAAK